VKASKHNHTVVLWCFRVVTKGTC